MTLFTALLTLHIASGLTALTSAIVAVASKNFDADHRVHIIAGRIFFTGMCLVGLTALPMALLHPNVFLLLIGLFSLYLATAGWRYARNRSGKPSTIDWIAGWSMAVVSLVMIGYAVLSLTKGTGGGIILLVFGGIGGALAVADLMRSRAGNLRGRSRIAMHLTMMLSATIAAITAFVVTNVTIEALPGFVLWLLPTVVVTPLIVWWNRRILSGTKRVRGAAE